MEATALLIKNARKRLKPPISATVAVVRHPGGCYSVAFFVAGTRGGVGDFRVAFGKPVVKVIPHTYVYI